MIIGLVASQRYCAANPKSCPAPIAVSTPAHDCVNADSDRAARFFFEYGRTYCKQ